MNARCTAAAVEHRIFSGLLWTYEQCRTVDRVPVGGGRHFPKSPPLAINDNNNQQDKVLGRSTIYGILVPYSYFGFGTYIYIYIVIIIIIIVTVV